MVKIGHGLTVSLLLGKLRAALYPIGDLMTKIPLSEEQQLYRAYAPLVTELVLLHKALGGIPIPKAVISTLFRWHFFADHKEARKAHAYLTDHGYWERENPLHRNGSRELTEAAHVVARSVLPKFPRKNLAELLRDHGLTPVQSFLKEDTPSPSPPPSPPPEQSPLMEESSLNEPPTKRLFRKRQSLVNHAFVEDLFHGAIPSPLSLWIFQQVWTNTSNVSPLRSQEKRSGHLEKEWRTGSTNFWKLTKSGRKIVNDSSLSPSLTEEQILSAIQKLGYRVDAPEVDEFSKQDVPTLSIGRRSEKRRFEVLADHLAVEHVYGQKGLPTVLSLAVFSRHYPNNMNPQSQPNRYKRDYGFMDRVKKSGNTYLWFVTEQGITALKERTIKSRFEDEERVRDFIRQILEQKQQRTSCVARKQKRRIFRADHLLFEALLDGPLPSNLSSALLKHHWPTSKMPYKHRLIEKNKDFFAFIGPDEEDIASFWTVTETGKQDLQNHKVQPSFSEEEAKTFLRSHGYPIQGQAPLKETLPSFSPSEEEKDRLCRELENLGKAIAQLQKRFDELHQQLHR
ncbi:TPA: hypothetical protein DEP26_03690 [Candidatus Uhrbacteria bacterium]|nr:MAG: hypothetical protein UT94_C0016G0009 [Candidatus Uhrbacteria bacterium GW2011_GWF2_40_263]HCB56046.1 hypothetical protein [Candidatus Uhrbacteria bacterium]